MDTSPARNHRARGGASKCRHKHYDESNVWKQYPENKQGSHGFQGGGRPSTGEMAIGNGNTEYCNAGDNGHETIVMKNNVKEGACDEEKFL